ncbi:MAG: helix-turn-helix transcriptional regulator [Clostridia bacterium]|nr:helix-turn-helix transcriptional regulator [Clostridia bacterium]MBQ8972206.1 helix-turn-helix transcriptional regulator [Clostridia bacterium]
MDYKALGKRIKTRRKQLKMTQEALAGKTDVSASYIGHIERGLKHCSLDTFVCICNVLQISPEALLQESVESALLDVSEALTVEERSILHDIAEILIKHHSD